MSLDLSFPVLSCVELTNEEVTEGESLTINCTQVISSHNIPASSPSINDSATTSSGTPPIIIQDLSDVHVVIGQQAELVMKTKGN